VGTPRPTGITMILSIESSCDDSAIAITEIATKKVLYHKKISQEAEHSCYGGVVPELASRLHAVALPKLLEETKPYFDKLKAVAVTLFPLLVLLISGGHTQVIRVESFEHMEILATSMDDSVGESFDKCAKMMGLGYPGGPLIEALALKGDENRFDLPVPLRNSPLIAFSLSGLKNAVRLKVEALGGSDKMSEQDRADLSASFQKAVKLHLLQKSKKIFAKESIKDFAIVGGASANKYIRNAYEKLCSEFGKILHVAPLEYCSDNAAMVGRYAIEAYEKQQFIDPNQIDIVSTKKQQSGMLL